MRVVKWKVVTEQDGMGGEREIAKFEMDVPDTEIRGLFTDCRIRQECAVALFTSIYDYNTNAVDSIKKRAMKKLTEEEKRALGLK